MSGSGGRRRAECSQRLPAGRNLQDERDELQVGGQIDGQLARGRIGRWPMSRGRFVVHPNPVHVAARAAHRAMSGESAGCRRSGCDSSRRDRRFHRRRIANGHRSPRPRPRPTRSHGRQDDGRFGLGRGFGPRVVLIRRPGRLHLTRGRRFRGQRLQAMGLDLHDLRTEAANDQRGLLPGRIGQRGETDGRRPDEFRLARGPNFQRRGPRAAKGDVPSFLRRRSIRRWTPAAPSSDGPKSGFHPCPPPTSVNGPSRCPAKCTTTRSMGAALEGVQAKE